MSRNRIAVGKGVMAQADAYGEILCTPETVHLFYELHAVRIALFGRQGVERKRELRRLQSRLIGQIYATGGK